MTESDQPKFVFREMKLTQEQQERLTARHMRSVREAVRKAWDAAK